MLFYLLYTSCGSSLSALLAPHRGVCARPIIPVIPIAAPSPHALSQRARRTTPRPIKLLRQLLAREGRDVVVTPGSTFENEANLAPTFVQSLHDRYKGTRLGRQEIHAELLTDTLGALWQLDWLDRDRVEAAPELRRIVVAIDLAVSNNEGPDETGIVVAGVTADKHTYVLEDLSGRYAPHEWRQGQLEHFASTKRTASLRK